MLISGWHLARRGMSLALTTVLTTLALGLMSASTASAESCPNALAREQTHAVSLPDCRAYEQVTPTVKNGNQAGVETLGSQGGGPRPNYATAAADGEALLFGSAPTREAITGALGETQAGVNFYWVSARSPGGWSTRAPLPPGNKEQLNQKENTANLDIPTPILPSAHRSAFAFDAIDSFGPAPLATNENAYLVAADGTITWLTQPSVPSPQPPLLETTGGRAVRIAGASPDLTTIYMAYPGTLVPEDEVKDPTVGDLSRAEVVAAELVAPEPRGDVGLYESHEGQLRSAGVLPDGSVDPYGAIPAATQQFAGVGSVPNDYGNHQVSASGDRIFFISPDPNSGAPPSDPPELYMRERSPGGGSRTILVSRSAVTGQPAAAAPVLVALPHSLEGGSNGTTYAYASPDGSHVFFESTERLTSDAPSNEAIKEYQFDTASETLSYLPEFAGVGPGLPTNSENKSPIVASSGDGSRLLFERNTSAGTELDVWANGITLVAGLPPVMGSPTVIEPSRASSDGGVFVFETNSPLPGFNNGGFPQVYRYVVSTGKLRCVSCPPAGVTPSGPARMTNSVEQPGVLDSRGVSGDLERVFFDTPDPLSPADTNGKRDVYEWDNGETRLLSSGTSSGDSFLMDNSEDGRDVFFATRDALVNSDTDGGYDIYDAREGGGFLEPTAAAACGAECSQGGGGPPASLGAPPSSATFTGEGNLALPAAAPPKPKTAAQLRAQRLRNALRSCKAKHGRARKACQRTAHKRYGPVKAAKTTKRTAG